MLSKLAKLENLIGHKFQDLKLLERAVTHRSWAFEKFPQEQGRVARQFDNEVFEFVGDSILGAVIAEQLYSKNLLAAEGDLTLMKHSLVNSKTLAEIAKELKLDEFIRVGKSVIKYRRVEKMPIMADALEAIIGAVFLDAGYVTARAFISKVFGNRIALATPAKLIDPKTELQEVLAANGLSAPVYKTLRSIGDPPTKVFFISLTCGDKEFFSDGKSIKDAERIAATEALRVLNLEPKPPKKK